MSNGVKSNIEGIRKRGTIQSVDRAARILKVLASGPRRLGVSEISDRLGLSRPTVHGLLQTLQAHGFVEQDRDSDKYQLGAGLLHLGNSYLDHNELRARSLVHAERLAGRAQAAVRVGVLHGPAVVDQALGTAALAGRFGDHDLAAILTHQQAGPAGPVIRPGETHSLQPGTSGWAGFGAPLTGGQP